MMKKTNREMKTTTVTIPIEQWQWVKDKHKFTYSGLLIWAIEQHKAWEDPDDIIL